MAAIERVQTIKLIERIKKNIEYCNKIGLEDSSIYKGTRVVKRGFENRKGE